MMRKLTNFAAHLIATLPFLLVTMRPAQAMPTFAQALGVSCEMCHTIVPQLNAYGRYVQRTAYSVLSQRKLSREAPLWIGEGGAYNSSNTPDGGVPKTSFGNLEVHAVGYLNKNETYHLQQWITQQDQPGGLDTAWVAQNNMLNNRGHLFVGKIENLVPSIYTQGFDIDGASASATLVGEHDWGATNDNRWGSKYAYVTQRLDLEIGYFLSGEDLNGATDFGPNERSIQWKMALARPDQPIEGGFFGSFGSIPVSTGLDRYRSLAMYVQADPSAHGRPGVLAVYQFAGDSAPGQDPLTQVPLGPTTSRGGSLEIFENLFSNNAVISVRHDFNVAVNSTVNNDSVVNLAFNVPHAPYMHAYIESALGALSTTPAMQPTWKAGILWAVPVQLHHASPHS